MAVAAVALLVWRERTWRRAHAAMRAERDRTLAELHDVSGLARDLRSPLQGVIGNTELMIAAADATAPVEELREIQSNAARAADIVRTMAAVGDTPALARRWQDLNEVVVRAVEDCRSELATSGARIEFDRSERLPLVYVDGRQLERALAALLHPASRPGRRRKGTPAILRTRHREGSDDRLVVEFDDRSGAGDASGLVDLAECRRIVAAHGGSVVLERPFRGGYRFVLELPVWTT
ncbi:MAG TPA: hypothetical protein VFA27_00615 [Vicinamibacterales bacterium]|nr:hypothetical protein [Vicinamibacterales bacterium]